MKQLTANELKPSDVRIGNLVRCFNPNKPGNPHDLIATISWKHLRLLTEEQNYTDYSGIPLNESWLMRMGFEKDDDIISASEHGHKWVDYENNGVRITLPYFSFIFNEGDNEMSIEYVHQIQNLYFALTGQELTINPKHEEG